MVCKGPRRSLGNGDGCRACRPVPNAARRPRLSLADALSSAEGILKKLLLTLALALFAAAACGPNGGASPVMTGPLPATPLDSVGSPVIPATAPGAGSSDGAGNSTTP